MTSGSASTGTSAASSSSSADYHMDKSEWMNRIETSHIDRSLMNRMVMNYLVTGTHSQTDTQIGSFLIFRQFQKLIIYLNDKDNLISI